MSPKRKKIAILGSTGSIGQQALQVIAAHPQHFELTLLAARSNSQQLYTDAQRFRPQALLLAEPGARQALSEQLPDATQVHPFEDFERLLKEVPIDVVLVAVVGFAGLAPTLAAIAAGKTIALANKETLVAGGALVMEALKRQGTALYPVDSEHSALFQCLMGESIATVDKIILTASGGPFYGTAAEDMQKIRPAEALAHPTWKMGPKVSIDSATMMNKGLEVIEAHWLFGLPAEKIEVLIHRQAWVHSLVQFVDGSQKAQLGPADMRIPIQLALSYPDRLPLQIEALDWAQVGPLSFDAPDRQRFPALPLCYEALQRGGNIPCALNAANEAAVEAFLAERIPFLKMVPLVAACLKKMPYIAAPSYQDLVNTDTQSRKIAQELINT